MLKRSKDIFFEGKVGVADVEEIFSHFKRGLLVLWKGASVARRSVGCLSLGPWIPFLLPHPFYNIFLFTAYYLFKLTHVTFSATSLLGTWIPFLLPHPFYNIFLFTAYHPFG